MSGDETKQTVYDFTKLRRYMFARSHHPSLVPSPATVARTCFRLPLSYDIMSSPRWVLSRIDGFRPMICVASCFGNFPAISSHAPAGSRTEKSTGKSVSMASQLSLGVAFRRFPDANFERVEILE